MRLRSVFAHNLKIHRQARGISQEELAQAADLDRSYVSLLENERYSASLDTIEKLAEVLKVEPAELLTRD